MDNIKVIDKFDGEYSFLSNFYPAPITIFGYTFQNNEAAFQAAKCPERMGEFTNLPPNKAKRLGRCVQLRSDWEQVKETIMQQICFNKFMQNKDLAEKLKATNNAILIEGNTWGDKCWGQVNGEGENKLGKILMKIRELIKYE